MTLDLHRLYYNNAITKFRTQVTAIVFITACGAVFLSFKKDEGTVKHGRYRGQSALAVRSDSELRKIFLEAFSSPENTHTDT